MLLIGVKRGAVKKGVISMIGNNTELLEDLFDLLNDKLFNGELPKAVITIQSASKCYGYITTSKVWNDDNSGEQYREICVSAEYLNRNIENVAATLCHEMVHLYCMCNGIQETSQNGRYHNKNFKVEAEKRLLKISYRKYIGYSVTEPSEEFIRLLTENGYTENMNYYRKTGLNFGGDSGSGDSDDNSDDIEKGKAVRKKSSTRKYKCPVCSLNIRATKDVAVICASCMKMLVKVS